MAISSSVILLLVALITTTIAAVGSPSPSPSHSQTPPPSTPHPPSPPSILRTPLSAARPPPPPPPPMKQNQLKNIVDALIGAGDFGGWANVLSSADPSAFPLTATLLIPGDDATSHYSAGRKSFDPFLIPYHVIPQRLTFSDLRRLPIRTRLPTLLPSKFIVVTNNSAANFTLDNSQLTQSDIFTNAAFAVHGISDILNYTVFGGAPPPPAALAKPKPLKKKPPGFPVGPAASVKSSGGASCACGGVVMILSIAVAVAVIFVQEFIWYVEINQKSHEHRQIVEEWTVSYRLAEGNRWS